MRIEKDRKEIIDYSYICDICNGESISHMVCDICSRDICYKCSRIDPRDTGDYPRKYCVDCFKIGEKYLEQIKAEEEKFDRFQERLEQKWKDEAVRSVKKSYRKTR